MEKDKMLCLIGIILYFAGAIFFLGLGLSDKTLNEGGICILIWIAISCTIVGIGGIISYYKSEEKDYGV